MEFEFIKKIRLQNIILFTFGLIGFVCTMYVDKNYLHIHVFQYGIPNFGPGYLIRTFAIFICIAMIFICLIHLSGRNKTDFIVLIDYSKLLEKGSVVSVVLFAVFFVLLSVFSPIAFNTLSKEDNLIEWGSALLLFACSFVFLMTWIKERNLSYAFKHFKWLCLVFSLVFFVIAMEEISWFQRIIEFDTPATFNDNLQQEANLHNFNTNYSENIYYFGAFIFLVVLPYFEFLFPNIISNKHLKRFIPRPYMALLGVVPCVFNYDRWDALITQLTFFSCLMILLSFRYFLNSKNQKTTIWSFIILLIVIQIVFLVNGDSYLVIYDVKEYKEFLIPLCFFIYSIDRFGLLKK